MLIEQVNPVLTRRNSMICTLLPYHVVMSSISTEQPSMDSVVGRRVHQLMWDRRITQTALGSQVGIDQTGLGRRLRGQRGWGLDEIVAVAANLQTTVAYLVGETDDPSWCTPRDLNPEPTVSESAHLADVIELDTFVPASWLAEAA